MRVLLFALIVFPVAAFATVLNLRTTCDGLLTDTYRTILFEAGRELVTVADLQHMIQTKDYFSLADGGPSPRDHIASALNQLRDADSKAIEAIVREELSRRIAESVGRAIETDKRAKIAPLVRRLHGGGTQRYVALGELSENQKTFVEIHTEIPTTKPNSNSLSIWDFVTGSPGEMVDELGNPMSRSFSFREFRRSADHKTLLLTKVEGDSYVLDLNTRVLRHREAIPKPTEKAENCLAVSPNGRVRVYARQEGSIDRKPPTYKLSLVDLDGGNPNEAVDFETVHYDPKYDEIAFSPDSSFFVHPGQSPNLKGSGPTPDKATIWNVHPLRARGKSPNRGGLRATISPDGRFFVVDGSVFDATDGRFLFKVGERGNHASYGIFQSLTKTSFSPDSKWLAVTENRREKEIRLYDLRDGSLAETLPVSTWSVWPMLFSHDGKFLIYKTDHHFWYVRDLSDFLEAHREY